MIVKEHDSEDRRNDKMIVKKEGMTEMIVKKHDNEKGEITKMMVRKSDSEERRNDKMIVKKHNSE